MTIYPYLRVIDPKVRFEHVVVVVVHSLRNGSFNTSYRSFLEQIIVSMLVHEMRTIALSSEMYSPGFTPMCSALGNRVNDM